MLALTNRFHIPLFVGLGFLCMATWSVSAAEDVTALNDGGTDSISWIVMPPRGMVMVVRAPDLPAAITNRFPFAESFEDYADGEPIVDGARGWVGGRAEWGDDPYAAVVTQWDYAYAGTHPLPAAAHSRVLHVENDVGLHVQGEAGEVWLDVMVNPTMWDEDEYPMFPAETDHTAFFLNTNRQLVVLGSVDTGEGRQPAWIDLDHPPVESHPWFRLTSSFAYKPDGTHNYFRVFVDGVPVQHAQAEPVPGEGGTGGVWFRCATDDADAFPGLTWRGTGYVDDLVVTSDGRLEPTLRLTIESDYGEAWPGVGETWWHPGDRVEAAVQPTATDLAEGWQCIGWTGSGCVPTNGVGDRFTFDIGEISVLTWLWEINDDEPLHIVTADLPAGMEMVPYSAQLEASGGVPPYTWSIASGFVESEQASSFEAVGTAWLSGMDQTYALALPFEFPFYGDTYSNCYVDIHGTMYFSQHATDFNPNIDSLANRPMIAALWRDYYPAAVTIFIESATESTTVRWHRAADDVNYSATLHKSGRIELKYGTGNANGGMIGVSAGDGHDYLLSVKSDTGSMDNADDIVLLTVGALPEGLSVAATGVISGTPILAGTYPVTFIVRDDVGDTASKEREIVIESNPNTRPVIDSTTPPEGVVTMDENSSQRFSVTAHDPEGAPLAYHWTLNGEPVGDGASSYTHTTDWGDAGQYVLRCYVSDDLWDQIVYAQWNIAVPVPPPSTLMGRVRGAGVPLEDAFVELRRVNGSVYRRVYTDFAGNYVLDQVRSGYYRMKAGADFYADVWHQNANHLDQADFLTVPAESVIGGLDFDLASGQSPALVNVTSEPAGADIYLDYWPTGEVTPAVINVGEVGDWDWAGYRLASHVITLKMPEHARPSPQAVPAVEAETIVVHFDLTVGATGAVSVVTTPEGAEVYVDYADAMEGVTPVTVGNLAPGSHTILLRKSGYLQPRPITAWVFENATTEVEIPLAPDTATIRMMAEVQSVPRGIPIYVDYLPSAQVTDAVVGLMDPASHTGSGWGPASHTIGLWHSASHTILLRREGAPPMVPRYVQEIADSMHRMLIHLSVDPKGGTDSSGDGIPDWLWEQHGYDPLDPPDVNAIADASGMTYGDKLRAGLIPGDPNSRFEMGGVEIAGDPEAGLTITFVFDTIPGRRYVVQARESLTEGGWTNISSVISATGYQTVFTTNLPSDAGNQFYRLIVLTP